MKKHSDPTSALMTVRETNGELYADSRDLARGLHLRHEKVLDKLDAHAAVFGAAFGTVRFQTGPSAGPKNDRPVRFAYLTETQVIGVATLARNTDAVVDFKLALVVAFRDARHVLEARLPAPTRLESLEQMVEAEKRAIALKAESERMKPEVTATLPTARADEESFPVEDREYSWEEAAAMFEEDGQPMSVARLLQILREEGVLIEGGKDHNLPRQKYVDAGYFRVYNQTGYPTPRRHDAHAEGVDLPFPGTGENPGTDAG